MGETFVLYIRLLKTATVNWGDGSADQTITGGTSSAEYANINHVYSQAGNYTITIDPDSASGGWFEFGANGVSTENLLRGIASGNRLISMCVKHIRLGRDIRNVNFNLCGNLGNLETITIPTHLTSFASRCFYQCFCLKCAVIPSGVTTLAVNFCYLCANLKFISIPKTVTTFGDETFYRCISLEMITIPAGTTSIPSGTFSNCASLTKAYIPSGVTTLGTGAFQLCASLKEISIPSSVTTVSKNAFYNCHSLGMLVFPSAVTVGETAFAYSYGMQGVVFQNGATFSDGSSMFISCYGLKKASLPANATVIKTKCFQYCYQLEEITIPNTVTTIEASAFQSCYNLYNIIVPASVTSIEANAFNGVKAKYFVFLGTTPPTLAATNVFSNTNSVPIYVPSEAVDTYKGTSIWSSFASRIEAIPEGLLS